VIESLQFTNFKSWRDTGPMRFGQITGLFGTNSSGKSSILQFLLMLKETAESLDRTQVLDFGGDADRNYVNLGSLQDVAHKGPGGQGENLSWVVAWSLPDRLTIVDAFSLSGKTLFDIDRLMFVAQINRSAKGPIVERFRYQFNQMFVFGMDLLDDGHYHLISEGFEIKPSSSLRGISAPSDDPNSQPSYPVESWPLPPPVKCYGFPDQVNAYNENTGFLNQFSAAFQRLMDSIYYLGPLREHRKRQYTWGGGIPSDMGRRGENVVNALLASRSMPKIRGIGNSALTVEEYVAYWLKELGLVHNIQLSEIAPNRNLYEVRIVQSAGAGEVLVSEVGFGISQVLPVLAICYYVPEGSTIILEQPEIHLHPSVQAGLADVFVDAVNRRQIQIILESHSEHLLTRLQRRMAEEEIDPDRIALSFCERRGAESKITPLDLDHYGNITNWPDGFFGDELGERTAIMENIIRRKKAAA
jgi:predicted ATPase